MLRTEQLLPTRSSLLERIKSSSADESWSRFFRLYSKLIYHAAVQHGLSDAEAQEVVQETMIRVNKYIQEFQYDPARGSFKGWLMTLTRSQIVAQFRKRRDMEVLDLDAEVIDPFSFQDLWDREWKANLMNLALERLRTQVTTRAFQIYSYCVLQENGTKQTAEALKVSRAAVYLTTHKLNKILKKELSNVLPLAECQ